MKLSCLATHIHTLTHSEFRGGTEWVWCKLDCDLPKCHEFESHSLYRVDCCHRSIIVHAINTKRTHTLAKALTIFVRNFCLIYEHVNSTYFTEGDEKWIDAMMFSYNTCTASNAFQKHQQQQTTYTHAHFCLEFSILTFMRILSFQQINTDLCSDGFIAVFPSFSFTHLLIHLVIFNLNAKYPFRWSSHTTEYAYFVLYTSESVQGIT